MTDSRTNRPNVIVFLTDQQRWDTSGLHGNPLNLMPNFDRFAREGTHVEQAITPQPLCAPARSSFQTGLWPTTSGCYKNGIPLSNDHDTIANVFNRAGYRTGYIGKWHLADHNPVPADQRGGYQDWLGSNLLEFTSEAYQTTLYNTANEAVELPGYRVDALTDAAIRYVDSHKTQPFFLFISYLEPHHQNRTDDYPAPGGYREAYEGRWVPPDLAELSGSARRQLGGYWGMVKRLDEAFGRLLDALKSLRLDSSTIVAFTSDHGCHFKTRNAEYKRSAHEASVRVPLALSGPGFDGGGHIKPVVNLLDLPPTLIDAAGIDIPDAMQGRSIRPLLNSHQADWNNDTLVQISESGVKRALRTSRWKYAVTAPELDGRVVPAADQYVEEFLYDLETDPYELDNLAGYESHRELSDSLRDRLIIQLVAAGEVAPTIVPAEPRPSGQRRVYPEEVAR